MCKQPSRTNTLKMAINVVMCPRSEVGSARVTHSLGFPSLCPRLPVYQTLSPRLPPIFAPQLAGTGPWQPELFELFALVTGMFTMFGMHRDRDW
jgi:hypothetical protein